MRHDCRTPLVWSGVSLLALGAAVSCEVGPNYSRPAMEVPATYKSAATQEAPASQPSHLASDWWTLFNDPDLTRLEEAATANNYDLKAAMARVAEARAAAATVESEFYPQITLDPSAVRSRSSGNRGAPSRTTNDIRVPFDLSYEIDIWGRVRRSVEASHAQVQASVDDYAVVLQTVQADVAQNYMNLRYLEAQDAIYTDSVALYSRQLELTRTKQRAGLTGQVDVVQVETLLDSAITQQIDIRRQRADTQHALAILVGRPPSDISLDVNAAQIAPPNIPPGLPADLLRQRPDVAQAEQNLIAASAQIGVAQANFLPVVRLTGDAGFESINVKSVLDWESRIWSLGPSISIPIFEGGKLNAGLAQAKARYDELAATYRSTVLGAFRDVEVALTDVHSRNDALQAQARAVAAAREYLRLSELEAQRGGIISTLQVLDADRTLLNSRLAEAQLLNQRLVSTVLLIKALGGGWEEPATRPDQPAQTGAAPATQQRQPGP